MAATSAHSPVWSPTDAGRSPNRSYRHVQRPSGSRRALCRTPRSTADRARPGLAATAAAAIASNDS